MIDVVDLSIPTLMAACRGNVAALPSFMVHDNDVWPTERVQLDTKNRIHLRRAVFLRSVVPQVPVRAGIWHRIDVQEFHVDLKAHHLQGSEGMGKPDGYRHSSVIVLEDEAGRVPGDEDYGDPISKNNGVSKSDLDAARIEAGGQLRGIRSAALGADRSE